jgi:hypothetical protein
MTAWLAAFGLTVAMELPWYLAGLTGLRLLPWRRALAAGFAVNAVTHPVLWWVLSGHPRWWGPAEVAVCAAEALMLLAAVRRDPVVLLLLSVAANTTSLAAGLLLIG